MARSRILILAATDLKTDGRVLRQINVLHKHAEVVVLCRENCANLNVHQIAVHGGDTRPFRTLKKAWRLGALNSGLHMSLFWSNRWNRQALREARRLGSFDAIVANDLETLPIAHAAAGKARVIFDAHEFYAGQFPDVGEQRLWNNHAHRLCCKYLPHIDGMMTTSPEMSEEYHRQYGIESVVIPNCPAFESIAVRQLNSSTPIKLVYHGVCREGRGIEAVVSAVKQLDARFELYLMFAGSRTCSVDAFARKEASECDRIHIIDPVSPEEIVKRIAEFDLGVSLIVPNTLNRRITTANKFFEAIQARLGILCGPVKTLRRYTDELGVGVTVDSVTPECVASTLSKMSISQINDFKANADRAAESHCIEAYAAGIIDTVLLKSPGTNESQNGGCYENAA